jgi:hypothetical protein
MCLRRAPEKYIAGAALDRADLDGIYVYKERLVYVQPTFLILET